MEKKINHDIHADNYEQELSQGLYATGYDMNYFAYKRVIWMSKIFKSLQFEPSLVIDFGCGTGISCPFFARILKARNVIGMDISKKFLEKARKYCNMPQVSFVHYDEYNDKGKADCIFCNGVFHHISPDKRQTVLQDIFNLLRPGGFFALWENNPWNPGTRYVMSRVSFDRGAITLSPFKTRRLLRQQGFEIINQSYVFFLPRKLSYLLFIEQFLSWLPLGGQYLTLGRKPDNKQQVY